MDTGASPSHFDAGSISNFEWILLNVLRGLVMKPQKLLPSLATLLCLTFGVAAQQTPPGQPAISLDFAQYCVGDTWKLKLSNGVANTSMRLLGTSNGQSWE